jgi:hypothetical protein
MRRRQNFEVDVEYLTLPHPETGKPCHLRQGDALPDWAKPDQIAALVQTGAVVTFGVI